MTAWNLTVHPLHIGHRKTVFPNMLRFCWHCVWRRPAFWMTREIHLRVLNPDWAVKQPNGITDPEYSIEIGVYCFSLKVKKTGCKSPADKNNLFKALQAYNMGDGFIDFCDTYYGGVWSVECARAYSEKMGGGQHLREPELYRAIFALLYVRYDFGNVSGKSESRGLCAPLEPGWKQNITQHFRRYVQRFAAQRHGHRYAGGHAGIPRLQTAK